MPDRNPARMTEAEIHHERSLIRPKYSAILDEMIAAGRGAERIPETRILAKAGDPLALRYLRLSDRETDLAAEMHLRIERGGSRGPREKSTDRKRSGHLRAAG